MYPILFEIGGLTFYSHGIMSVLGIIVGTFVIYLLAAKRDLDTSSLFDNIVFTVLGGIIGARLSYYVVYNDQFSNFSQIFRIWEGGLISYGGFFLGLLVFILLLKYQKQPILKWLDLFSIGFFLGLLFGRFGNLFAGEYDGIYSTSKFLTLNGIFGNSQIIPVPFFEAILCLVIFMLGLFSYKKLKNLPDGLIFLPSMIIYSGVRTLIDFWRSEGTILLHLSIGQITSIVVFIISVLLLILYKKGRIWNAIR